MYSKLTLNIKKSVIEKAKSTARSKNKSLSKLVETYLENLSTSQPESLVDWMVNHAPTKKTNPGTEKQVLTKRLKEKYGA